MCSGPTLFLYVRRLSMNRIEFVMSFKHAFSIPNYLISSVHLNTFNQHLRAALNVSY